MNEPGRALARFESLLKGRMPVVLIPPARHGRALALYGLKRYAEARDEWVALLASNPPRPLAERGDVLAGGYARPPRGRKGRRRAAQGVHRRRWTLSR